MIWVCHSPLQPRSVRDSNSREPRCLPDFDCIDCVSETCDSICESDTGIELCDLYPDVLLTNYDVIQNDVVNNDVDNVGRVTHDGENHSIHVSVDGSKDSRNCADMCVNPTTPPEGSTLTLEELRRLNPVNLVAERIHTWPTITQVAPEYRVYYQKVHATGLPNVLDARLPLPSGLNIPNWHAASTGHYDDNWLCELIEFGFPLQYTGHIPSPCFAENHPSGVRFPKHVRQYLEKERAEGTLLGPFPSHPFPDSGHINPIMSRPKSDKDQRRIIVDLSFPPGRGVNSRVYKGCVFGSYLPHRLPTISQAVAFIRARRLDVLMAVIDIERAYRNFRGDPLDWPLSVIQFDNKFYIDVALPFGARMSSLYVQKVAEFLARALLARSIPSLIYLDDLFLFLPNDHTAGSKFNEALGFIRDLGLPVNASKLITPNTQAVWLGVLFHLPTNTISIPPHKVNDLLSAIQAISDRNNITRKETQSIIGRVAHVARVVHPARLFMCRILNQLRESQTDSVFITPAVRADLTWFTVFFRRHNASAIIPQTHISLTIEADTCHFAGAPGPLTLATTPSFFPIKCVDHIIFATSRR